MNENCLIALTLVLLALGLTFCATTASFAQDQPTSKAPAKFGEIVVYSSNPEAARADLCFAPFSQRDRRVVVDTDKDGKANRVFLLDEINQMHEFAATDGGYFSKTDGANPESANARALIAKAIQSRIDTQASPSASVSCPVVGNGENLPQWWLIRLTIVGRSTGEKKILRPSPDTYPLAEMATRSGTEATAKFLQDRRSIERDVTLTGFYIPNSPKSGQLQLCGHGRSEAGDGFRFCSLFTIGPGSYFHMTVPVSSKSGNGEATAIIELFRTEESR
jgi:hypothetical protein